LLHHGLVCSCPMLARFRVAEVRPAPRAAIRPAARRPERLHAGRRLREKDMTAGPGHEATAVPGAGRPELGDRNWEWETGPGRTETRRRGERRAETGTGPGGRTRSRQPGLAARRAHPELGNLKWGPRGGKRILGNRGGGSHQSLPLLCLVLFAVNPGLATLDLSVIAPKVARC
jgi:hypothetical protein